MTAKSILRDEKFFQELASQRATLAQGPELWQFGRVATLREPRKSGP
jgi:hypothetical protein